MIDQAVAELTAVVGVRGACAAVGQAQARWYRRHRQSPPPRKPERAPKPSRGRCRRWSVPSCARCSTARARRRGAGECVRQAAGPGRLPGVGGDDVPGVLRAHDEVGERRRQASHPAAKKPELLATRPNQVYSWDITKLLGPVKWTYFVG